MKHTVNPLLFALLFSSILHGMNLEKLKNQIENAQGDAKPILLRDAYADAMEKKLTFDKRGTKSRKELNQRIKFIDEEIKKLPKSHYELIAVAMEAYAGLPLSDGETRGTYKPFHEKRQQCKKLAILQGTKEVELKALEEQSAELDAQIVALQKKQTDLSKLHKSKQAESAYYLRSNITLKALQQKDLKELSEVEKEKKERVAEIEKNLELLASDDAKALKNTDLTQRTQDRRKIKEQIEKFNQEKTTLSSELIVHAADLLKMNQRLNPEKYPTVTAQVTNTVTSAVWGTVSVLKNAVGLGASVEQPSDDKPDNKA